MHVVFLGLYPDNIITHRYRTVPYKLLNTKPRLHSCVVEAGFVFESMGKDDVSKWPGSCFHNEGSCWTCRICGLVASNKVGNSLRKSVRKFHTVSRCAKGLRSSSDVAKAKAVENVEGVGSIYLEHFMEELSPTVPGVSGPSGMPAISTRSRSRSPKNLRRENAETEIAGDFLGRRIAKKSMESYSLGLFPIGLGGLW